MATSGTIEKKFHGGSSGGYYFGIDWKVNSQSTSNNSSNVTASVFIRTTGNGYTISSSATKNITLTINGTSYSGTATVGIGANTKKTLLTKTVDIKHNSDGTKTCAFACSGVLGLTLSGKYYGTVSHSGNGTFNTINLNTAPTWTTDDTRMKIGSNEIKANVIIPENTSSVSVISAQATDAETPNGLNYYLHRYINGNYSAQIKAGGTSLTGTDNISSWGQGTQIKYEAKVSDGSLWASGSRWSWVYTKNTFTRASVTSIGSIGVGSTGVSFTATGIRNSGGGNGYVNTSFGYRIESLTSGVNIYGENTTYQNNQNNVDFRLGIKNNGGSPTNPHWLDANELRAAFRNSNYTGTLKLRLVSWNSYGSQGYVDFSVSVDLRKSAPSTTVKYAANNKITHSGTDYYIPAHLPFIVSWNAVNDTVEGNACTYDVYYQVGSGSLKYLGSTTGTSYTAYLGGTEIGNNKTTNFKIVVRVKTKYGTTTDCSGAIITLWDYAPPIVRVNTIDRTSTNVTLTGTITINTTIPSVTLTNTRWRWVDSSNTNFRVTDSSNEKIKNFTLTVPAAQDLTGTIHIESSDTARDLIANIVTMPLGNTEVSVKGYMPVMSLTKQGVGINTRPKNGYKFSVDGNAKFTNGSLESDGLILKGKLHMKPPTATNYSTDVLRTYDGDQYGMGLAIQSGGTTIVGSGESAVNYATLISDHANEILYLTSDSGITFASNCNTIENRIEATLKDGLFTVNTNSASANKGVKILGTAGKALNLWVGTGGGVLQTLDDYNLHLGRNSSTTDMVFHSDRIETRMERVAYGSINHDVNAGERRVTFGSGLTRYWGMYGHSDGLGWYDWKNSRSVMSYTPSTGNIEYYQTIYLSGMPSTSDGRHLTVNTSHDSNGFGDGKTHIGYRTSTGYHHYFRGTGAMNINCKGGTSITGNLRVGGTVTSGKSLAVASDTYQVRLSSEEGQGAVLNCSSDDAEGSFLFSENGFSPQSDNSSYCGTTSNRWQVVYSSTGSVYSSSKDEKEDIRPLNVSVATANYSSDKKKSVVDTIIQGLKNIPLYTYKYKTLESDNQFVGFLGQELEEMDPEFFDLIGSSYEKIIEEPDKPTILPLNSNEEEKEIKTIKQYDIRETSLNGVLMVGLQQALLKIDELENKIKELEGGLKNV